MSERRASSAKAAGAGATVAKPNWITPALIEKTIEVWQPYYETGLGETDAIEILASIGRLFDVLTSRPK